MRFSKHSKQRIKERTNINRKERVKVFRQALDKGLSLHQAEQGKYDPIVIKYLRNKSINNRARAKIYDGYIYIYSKGNKTLYTMYKIPNEIQELINEKENRK